uniref:Retrotransposon protein, putative, Ty1-copia subclass n=1 Tax=Tanacetum cinerariifolium TaxID=118510 RepID=A0A6L2MBL0_TANCI|nr:retrotransposon protein, putative, Ty1-copia subclass [Tanacetum cinerariifolium]
MKIEYWITNNDMNIWKVIQNGSSLKRTGRDRDERVIILPSTTADEHIVVQRESKARTTLLQSIPNDHVADFHYMDDARDIWNAVKARFGGNAKFQKMRKSMLKQEFLEFRIGEAKGLHKGYDRMQKILSQLNQLKAKPEDKYINLKFLRALPSSWSQVALTLKTKGGLEVLSFDDLYYKLKTLEVDVKGYTTFSSSQSAGPSHYAFVSTTSASKKMSYGDSLSYSLTTTYTAPSNSKTGGVTFYIPARRKISEHIDEFNKIVLDLENIKVKFENEDLALLLLTSLPASYEHFEDTLLYRREALTLEDVMATLNSKKIKERSKAKGDDGEGLYVKGRSDHRDSRDDGDERTGTGSARLDHDSGYSYHMAPWLDIFFDFMECNRGSVQLGDNRECKIRGGYGFISLGSNTKHLESSKSGSTMHKNGIARHLTVTGTPQQNGVAKRMNRTLMDKVRCLLIQSRLPKTFWAEATCTAAYLINRSPSRVIEKKIPMEMCSGHPSDYGMLRISSCVAYPHDKQVTSRNVVFNESVMYKDTLKDSGASDKFVEELQVEVKLQRLNDHAFEEDQTDQEDGDDEDAGDQATDQPPDLTDYQLKNKTSELVEHPARKKLVSCNWMFKTKEQIKGVQNPRYKARLVARGFTQRAGIDYNEVFSLVVRHTSIRVILALTACKDYELEQPDSPRQLYKRFDEYMLNNKFKRRSYDNYVYYRSYAPGEYIYLLLYVDDILIACKSKAKIGDQIHKILRVSQSGYVSKILNNFRIDNGKSIKMPLGGHFKLSLMDYPVRDYDVERTSKAPYENAVRSLMYLVVCTRPDIPYAVSVVSRYLANPGFVDSDYAKDPNKGRSITGYAFLVQGCVVSWKVTLQHVVALSTTEAEYMALTEAVKEAIWLRGLLEELGVELNIVTVNCDNQGAIHLSRNHVFHKSTKHINVRYHFIREVLEAKTVKVLNANIKPKVEIVKFSLYFSKSLRLAEHQESTGRRLLYFLADLCIKKLANSKPEYHQKHYQRACVVPQRTLERAKQSIYHQPMLLDYDDVQHVSDEEIEGDTKRKAKVGNEDLSKPFKEVLKCPFTRRIVKFSSPGYRMPVNAKIYDGMGDPEDHVGRFVGMGNQGEWPMLSHREVFMWLLFRAKCEIGYHLTLNLAPKNDMRGHKAGHHLVVEVCVGGLEGLTSYLTSFIACHHCEDDDKPKSRVLSLPFMGFAGKISSVRLMGRRQPRAVTCVTGAMWKHVNRVRLLQPMTWLTAAIDVISATNILEITNEDIQQDWNCHLRRVIKMFQQTLDGKARAWFDKIPPGSIDNWGDLQEKFLNRFGMLKACDKDPMEISKIVRKAIETLPNLKERWPRENRAVLTLDSLSSTPQEIFATKHQLRLPQPAPLLEQALESGKLNYLIKDVRQRGRAGQRNNGPQKAKVINMVQCLDWKRKNTITDEKWMNIPITFPLVLARDLSKEALVVEAEVEGYLVRRTHIDEGALVEIMFEQCFNMLHPSIRSRLGETQTTRLGFSREQVKPLGKIKLDVCFGGSGLCQRAIMKFTIILEPSPYNIILGCSNLKQLRAILSTIHGLMKFLIPWGIATLVSHAAIIFECMREGKKQAVERPKETKLQEKAGIVRPVQYPTWISNPVLVMKVDESWRMFIDFKNINSACPKDYYLFPEIDSKIESVVGFPLKCFLDAYKGYHQVQMVEEDEEKTAFYTDQDDMVVKSKFKREMLADIAETFDNLRRINMKLNLKRCSFGVKEGKFIGYMVTSKGKLAALNRFLSRSAKKSLPFFETLKDITKANKHDYRWTKKAEDAFQELKKMILDLPVLTTLLPKETLFVYLATSKEAFSAVLLLVRKGKQRLVHYIRRTLHDAERNHAPLEKITLALWHVSRRLRRYFEAHPITVIIDKPIKQIPNKADTSGKLAQYSVELGAYNITFDPHSTIKGHVLGDFINEIPVGSEAIVQRCFKNFKIQNIPRNKNQKANVLRKLASVAFNHLTKEVLVETLDVPSMYVEDVNAIVEEEGETWMTPIVNCLEKGYGRKTKVKPITSLGRSTWEHASKSKVYGRAGHAARWGMDVLGALLESPRKVKFVIVVIDYFTKWIEAKPLAKTIGKEANGLVERANRSLIEGIKTQLGQERKGLVDELPNVLWAHWISLKTSNGETPYNLTFGSEAVISTEIGMPIYRTMMIKEGDGNKEEMRLNLDILKERKEAAVVQEAKYKMKMEQYNNKRVRPVSFKVGEYVYRKNEASRVENLGKLGPKWKGPYLVVEVY